MKEFNPAHEPFAFIIKTKYDISENEEYKDFMQDAIKAYNDIFITTYKNILQISDSSLKDLNIYKMFNALKTTEGIARILELSIMSSFVEHERKNISYRYSEFKKRALDVGECPVFTISNNVKFYLNGLDLENSIEMISLDKLMSKISRDQTKKNYLVFAFNSKNTEYNITGFMNLEI